VGLIAGRILSVFTSTSSSAPPSNPHSARCTAIAKLPGLRALRFFWTPAAKRVEVRHAASKLHKSRHRIALCDHLVGAARERQRHIECRAPVRYS